MKQFVLFLPRMTCNSRALAITKLFNYNPFYLSTEGIGINYIQNWITVKSRKSAILNKRWEWENIHKRRSLPAIMQSLFSYLEATTFKKQLSFLGFIFFEHNKKNIG